ncbi:hypothetical protein C8J57DRAFT_1227769 [Mycena rebaudengoi]|nr:hypothetical protein C8J57DRAFT_1227769 [Mycena rebaudengoi]
MYEYRFPQTRVFWVKDVIQEDLFSLSQVPLSYHMTPHQCPPVIASLVIQSYGHQVVVGRLGLLIVSSQAELATTHANEPLYAWFVLQSGSLFLLNDINPSGMRWSWGRRRFEENWRPGSLFVGGIGKIGARNDVMIGCLVEEGADLDVDLDEEEVNDLEDLEDDYLDDDLEEEDVEEEKIISCNLEKRDLVRAFFEASHGYEERRIADAISE